METQAYPLHWPDGWPRTALRKIEHSRFRVTPDSARKGLLDQIRQLVGRYYRRDLVILSTNLRLRQDGEPYASQRPPEDQGVAVYFDYKGKSMVFACDRWSHIHDNMHAIAKSIEALRGIERWGASDMLERAFTGFAALEYQDQETWQQVLQMGNRLGESDTEWLHQAERHHKILRSEYHPDRGGDVAMFHRVQLAIEQARAELGGVA